MTEEDLVAHLSVPIIVELELCRSVSYACRSLAGLELFPHLEEVILDSNGLTNSIIESLPTLRKVNTLSLNKNNISFCVHLFALLLADVVTAVCSVSCM